MLPFSRYSGSSRIKNMDSFLDFLVFLTMAVIQHAIVRCCNAQDAHRITTVAINCIADIFFNVYMLHIRPLQNQIERVTSPSRDERPSLSILICETQF